MKQCDSPYIVKYFGSYFKDADLYVKLIIRVFFSFLIELSFVFLRLLWNIVVLVRFRT